MHIAYGAHCVLCRQNIVNSGFMRKNQVGFTSGMVNANMNHKTIRKSNFRQAKKPGRKHSVGLFCNMSAEFSAAVRWKGESYGNIVQTEKHSGTSLLRRESS
jgi:hypothetical protein